MDKLPKNLTDAIIEVLERKKASYFFCENGESFIQVAVNNKIKTFKIRSKHFLNFLRSDLSSYGIKIKNSNIDDIVENLEALCQSSNVKKKVFIRIGYNNLDEIIIDLANESNDFVVISKTGYIITQNIDIPFIRTIDQCPLPVPMRNSSVNFLTLLSKYFNFKRKNDIYLVLAFLIKLHLIKVDSCVIFVFQGKQDSGKSSSTEAIKFLIDPTDPLLSSAPKIIEDVVFNLYSNYFPAFDNLSGISKDLSDFLCSVVYGVKYSKRLLYTDDTLKNYKTKRDLLFNGIEELSNRDDLNDRIVEVELESIEPNKRKDKTTLNKEMENDRPYILHGLYQLISQTMAILPSIRTTNLPRMSDYARIGMAMFKSLEREPEEFLTIYNEVIKDKKSNSFWNDPLCYLIFEQLKKKIALSASFNTSANEEPELRGTSMELMDLIFSQQGKGNKPKTPRGFSAYLKRNEGLLKSEGIVYSHTRSTSRREIVIKFEEEALKKFRNEIEQEIEKKKNNRSISNLSSKTEVLDETDLL